MFQFFESVAGIFGTVVDYIVGLFEMLINLIKFIFKAQSFLLEVINSLPPFLLPFAIVTVAIVILFQVLNKGG